MPKRFTDTDIWKKKWYRQLSPNGKIAFKYIMDNCDNVGVWDGDTEVADFLIGEDIDWASLVEKINGNIQILDCGKWWVVDFVRFQHQDMFADYKDKEPSNACKSYARLLQKHNLFVNFPELFEAYGKPTASQRLAPKEQEQEQEKVKVKDKEKEQEALPSEFTSLVDKVKNGKKRCV